MTLIFRRNSTVLTVIAQTGYITPVISADRKRASVNTVLPMAVNKRREKER
jgi:hypothetical protein